MVISNVQQTGRHKENLKGHWRLKVNGHRNGTLPDKEEIFSLFDSVEEFHSFIEGKDDGFDYSIFL